ncbi:insecticidal delta-endotoxin Cry8Ea1 family protein [Bacillus mycoides]|uniref:insecticidal delta-endotoxin Cry8Ea1 family protein n=1 Tax=Bacillus mycoides TaxID=1405 RepID=UPI003D65648C
MKNKKKYMKPLAIGLLATNIIGFGTQTVAFAATDKAASKEQMQKQMKTQNKSFNPTVLASMPSDTSELQKMLEDAIKNKDTQITPELIKKLQDKGFDYLSIVKVLTGGLLKQIPYAGSILSPLVTGLFPGKGYVTKENVWGEIQDRVSNLIDQKLEQAQIDNLIGKLNGVHDNLGIYQNQVGLVNGIDPPIAKFIQKDANSDKDQAKAHLRDTIRGLDRDLGRLVPQFAVQGFEAASLPYYVQIANVHLFLLKDALTHADEWQLTTDEKKNYLSRLQNKIQEYSTVVYDSFNKGVEAAKSKGGSTADSWNRVNSYVRTMTLYGLDFVALWPAFDTKHYQQPIKLQQTRELYSNMLGRPINWQDYDTTLQQIHNSGYAGYPGELKQISVSQWDRIDGIKELFDWTGDGSRDYTQKWGGANPSGYSDRSPTLDNPAIGISAYESNNANYYNMSTITYKKNNEVSWFYGPFTTQSDSKDGSRIDSKAPAGHKLSRVKVQETRSDLNTISSFVAAYIPEEVHPQNILEAKAITGIPAEKYLAHAGFENKIEYINGSNAMVSSKNGDTIDYNVQSPGNQKYKIRLRVATNSDTSVGISINGNSQQVNIKNTEASSKIEDGIKVKGVNGNYMLIEGPTVELKEGRNTIQLKNSGGAKIALDRIEFEPIGDELRKWKQEGDKWYLYDENDKKLTGWQKIDGVTYYLNKTGDGSGMNSEGERATGWKTIDGVQYYFNKTGDGSGMQHEGEKAIGWKKVDGVQYYFNETGDGSGMKHEGEKAIGWKTIDGVRYYFNRTGDGSGMKYEGEKAIGWKTIDGVKYYFNRTGDGSGMQHEGEMAVGNMTIDGVKHYFNKTGDRTGYDHEGELEW